MRIDDGRESENIEDRRGSGYSSIGGLIPGGRLGIAVAAVVALLVGVDPRIVFNVVGHLSSVAPQAQSGRSTPANPEAERTKKFMSVVLADTEDTWGAIFSQAGRRYEEPKLVLYSGQIPSACGLGRAAMGPFYCPGDRKLYLDMSFFDELANQLGSPGDFAQAYVVAHEVGHHVQNLLGIAGQVHAAQQRGSRANANQLQVRMELQADCFAGIWAHHADKLRQVLEPGDMEEALAAASGVGDDRLQKQAQGYVVPESFTHGSSEQRMRWFGVGAQSGDVKKCDTFKVSRL